MQPRMNACANNSLHFTFPAIHFSPCIMFAPFLARHLSIFIFTLSHANLITACEYTIAFTSRTCFWDSLFVSELCYPTFRGDGPPRASSFSKTLGQYQLAGLFSRLSAIELHANRFPVC